MVVVAVVEHSRLLRRGLFVVALAAAGWLLGVIFASSASADELAGDTQTESSGLIGGLLDGLTGTLGGITTSLVDTSGDLLSVVTPEPTPTVDLPSLLPDTSSGSASTDRDDVTRSETPAPAPVVTPPAPVAPPAPVVVAPPAPAAPAPVVAVVPVKPAAPVVQPTGTGVHAGRGGSEPEPLKAPAAPAGSGATMAGAHDNAGSTRTTYGVLSAHATLHPADAGFTTRSRAANAAGRLAGLPASSPD